MFDRAISYACQPKDETNLMKNLKSFVWNRRIMSRNLLIIDWGDGLVHNELHESVCYIPMVQWCYVSFALTHWHLNEILDRVIFKIILMIDGLGFS